GLGGELLAMRTEFESRHGPLRDADLDLSMRLARVEDDRRGGWEPPSGRRQEAAAARSLLRRVLAATGHELAAVPGVRLPDPSELSPATEVRSGTTPEEAAAAEQALRDRQRAERAILRQLHLRELG